MPALLAAGWCAVAAAAEEPSAPGDANDGGAALYVRWIATCMHDMEKQLPPITRSAEAAVRL
jgi:hypothetical protein